VSRRHPVITQLQCDKEEVVVRNVIDTERTDGDAAPLTKMPIIMVSEIGQRKRAQRKDLKRRRPNVKEQTVSGKSVRQKTKVDVCCSKVMRIEDECRLQDIGFNASLEKSLVGQHELLRNTVPLEAASECGYGLVASEHSYVSFEIPNAASNENDQGGCCRLDYLSSLDNSLLFEGVDNNGVESSLRSQTVASSALPALLRHDGKRKEGLFDKSSSTFAQSKSVFPCPEASSTCNALASALPGSYISESCDLGSPSSCFDDGLLLINEEAVEEEEIVEDGWSCSEVSRMVNEVTSDASFGALVSPEVKHIQEMQRTVMYFKCYELS